MSTTNTNDIIVTGSNNEFTVTTNPDKEQLLRTASAFMESVTTKNTWKDKLKSRKFWFSVAGVVTGILGMIGFRDSTIGLVSFSVIELGSILGYVISEGVMDANTMKKILEIVGVIIDNFSHPDDTTGDIVETYEIIEDEDKENTVSDDKEKDTDTTFYI